MDAVKYLNFGEQDGDCGLGVRVKLCLTAQFNLKVLSAQEHPAQIQGLWVHSCLGLLDLIQVQIHTWIIWALAAVCWFQLFMSE